MLPARRRPLGELIDEPPTRSRDLACPFGCGDTLIYTTNGVQCADDACASLGGPISRIPARSPYQHGDRVQLHGYPGEEAGHRRTGFRGVVTGSLGATILRGATDDGEEWDEYWGALDRENVRPRGALMYCSCCPRPVRRPVQMELFDLAPSR